MRNLNQILKNAIQILSEFSLIAKFSPNINLVIKKLPEIKGKTEGESNEGLVWHENMWMTPDAQDSLGGAPASLGNISLTETDRDVIKAYIENLKESYNVKADILKLKDLYNKYYETEEKRDPNLFKEIKESWRKIQDQNIKAIANRIEVLKDLKDSDIIPEKVCIKIKSILLRVPNPTEAIKTIERALEIPAEKTPEVKKKEPEETKGPKGPKLPKKEPLRIKEEEPKEVEEPKEPKVDKDKKEFGKEDIPYIINIIKENEIKDVPKLVKKLEKFFNTNLLNELLLAARTYGGMPGVLNYLYNYKTKKPQLEKKLKEEHTPHLPSSQIPEIKKPLEEITNTIDKIKDLKPPEYHNSYFQFTEDVLNVLNEYQKGTEKSSDVEDFLLGFIEKLQKDWKKLGIKEIEHPLHQIHTYLSGELKGKEIKEYGSHPLLTQLNILQTREKQPFDKGKEKGPEKSADEKILEFIKERKLHLLKKKPKSSLEKLSEEYNISVFGKLEKLIGASEDLIIRGELEDILGILKSNS